ncbi:ATP-binding protein [Pimelobacter sp. 30-1]|uniref:sensor histidine kinase n=1 Tax=Pimelobacter sp. 30-1 TaxID=2004991 RepID=UPI001C054A8F|nr:ATP-binding protein [Pimelobacter sp. 30-1]
MRPRRRLWGPVATAGLLLSWAAILGSLVGLVLRPVGRGEPFAIDDLVYVLEGVVALVNGVVAALVLSRRQHVVGWIFALVALGFTLALVTGQLAVAGVGSPGVHAVLAHAPYWVWVPGAYAAALVLPWALRAGHPPLLPVVVGGVVAVGTTLIRLLHQQPDAPPHPWAVGAATDRVLTGVGRALLVVTVVLAAAALASLVRRALAGDRAERTASAWVAVGLGLLAIAFVGLRLTPVDAVGFTDVLEAALFLFLGSQLMIPVAALTVVLRGRMWGLDVAVSRATVWAMLTALVVVAYSAVVWLWGRLMPSDDRFGGYLSVGLLALAVQPVRRGVQREVDRLVYGQAPDPAAVLRTFAEDGAVPRTPGESLQALAEALASSLRLGHVAIVSDPAPAGPDGPDARVGAAPDEAREGLLVLPLQVGDRRRGELRIGPRPGTRLDERTRRLAEGLTGLVAITLEVAQVNAALDRARSRLVEVRHEERRLLRRELHDSLGPSLAGVGLGLTAVEQMGDDQRAARSELIGRLRTELVRRTEDMRTMARALLPPALDDGDLVGAVGTLVERIGGHGLAIDTDLRDVDRLAPRTQVAVYLIVSEALLNVRRHADATRCLVEVRGTGPTVVRVSDDGAGLDPAARPGVGIASMRERAEELGGALALAGDGPGTTIEVRIP